jgi:hypothetical protein
MPSNVISVRDLEEEDVKLLESPAECLRAKRLAAAGKTAGSEEDSFERSAGSWGGLVDG